MKKLISELKDLKLHLIGVVVFLLITAFYFTPYLQGQKLKQMDNTHALGMAKEATDYQEKTGEYAAWTNSMFSGMPSYLIKGAPNRNIFNSLSKAIRLGLPFESMAIIFIMLLGFYFLLITLEVNMWLSIAGAIAFTFSSYNFIFIEAGHITKAYAIAYMAPVIAGVILTFKGKYIKGGIITTIAIGLEMASSHPQITYYIFLMILVMGLIYLGYAIKEKAIKNFFVATAIIVGASILGTLPSASNLITTYEYGKYSIRGASELTPLVKDSTQQTASKVSTGLDKDYALDWSYGKQETFTLLVPSASGGQLSEDSETYKGLIANGIPAETALDFTKSLSQATYWGAMPFVSGPAYFGAIVCFLFVLGLIIVKDRIKWWLLSITLLSILLAWGKNFSPLTDIFFDYFPFYNKFRAVSTILVIASVAMPILGLLAVDKIVKKDYDSSKILKQLYIALGIVGGLTLLLAIMPGLFFDFTSTKDAAMFTEMKSNQYPEWLPTLLSNSLIADRSALLSSDAFRSFIFIALAGIALWLYIKNKLNLVALSVTIAALILVDLWTVNKRYLNEEDFVSKGSINNEFMSSQADYYVQADTDPHFRVFNIAANTFNDGVSPYKYKSIGGYHGAKMRRYQDLIERYLGMQKQNILIIMQQDTSGVMLPFYLSKMNALNMLNPKYIIYNPESQPLMNPFAKGNAWYVNNYKLVKTPDEEITMINDIQLSETAIVNKEFEPLVKDYNYKADSTSYIKLTAYTPNTLTYSSSTATDRLTLFSEIYYDKGWNAYVDGKPVPHFRANYVLRAMIVPAGKHTIEFKFEPSSLKAGQAISLISSILVILVIGGALVMHYRKSEAPVLKDKK